MSASNGRTAQCIVAGGGPAGMMLGFLLARAGVETVVLEKHADFLRDFRGDTVHPSTLDVMADLGLLEEFLKQPHQELKEIHGKIGDLDIAVADFSHLPTQCHFAALMPQWDFLNFLAEAGKRYPAWHVMMEAEVTGLIEENGRIVGTHVRTRGGSLELRAALVIGADGRHSVVRAAAKLPSRDLGSPIDVLWMRLPKKDTDPRQTLGYFNFGRILVTLDRGDYWQCAYVIHKDGFKEVQTRGLDAFHEDLVRIAPFFRDRVSALTNWDQIKLLTVTVDRLEQWWRPGLLCIGDAAHAMSPIGGVGINLAIQDAVAAANILIRPLKINAVTDQHLVAVQRRRMFPTRVTQAFQVLIQDRILSPIISSDQPARPPAILRLFNHWPFLRRFPARFIGVGVRPEHPDQP